MLPLPPTPLHGGAATAVPPLEYLFRVLLHLVAFGVVAVLVSRGLRAVDTLRSASDREREDGASER